MDRDCNSSDLDFWTKCPEVANKEVTHTEHYILVIDQNNSDLDLAYREWLKHNILLCVVRSIPDAIKELSEKDFLFVAVFSQDPDCLTQLHVLQQVKPVSILIYPPGYDIDKRTLDFFGGIDTFFGSEPDMQAVLNQSKAFFGYKKNRDIPPATIYTYKDLLMIVEYRKLYLRNQAVSLSKSNFDMLELLLSQIGRVFTYEQLYYHAFHEDAPIDSVQNAVRCHIRQIRRILQTGPGDHYIDTVRGIGHRMSI